MTAPPSALTIALADRYRVERELGRGGMATVYLAQDLKHDRPVALKVLRPELAAGLGTERFEREIRLAARLQHPNILTVHDSGEAAGQLWFTMPLVEGESLRDRMSRETQLTVEDAVLIAREVALALEYAHQRGVVHRDIKPENLLLTADGSVMVADFGIARPMGTGEPGLTSTGIAIGTPAYMSPEQASGSRDVDGRAEVYALGCVLFEMLAGEPPYTGPTPQAIIARALTETPRPIHPTRVAVPEALDTVIARAMAATVTDRFGRAGDLADALERSLVAPASPHDPDAPVDPRHIVAVLPFRDLSADSSQAYFAAGMTEEIAGQVSRISALRLVSQSATAPYAAAPNRLRRLANDLGVGSVVEGTTRLAGGLVRVGVSVTDARSGQTLWSTQYDRDVRDVLAVQGDVARDIATALAATLTPEETRRFGRTGTRDPEAYELYLRSRQLSRSSPAQNRAGIELLQHVLRKDPHFAAAWAALAHRYDFAAYFGSATYRDSGLVAAERAVVIDPELPDAHFATGDLLSAFGRNPSARLAYLRTLELDPNHTGAMQDLSLIDAYSGRYDESLYWALRAVPLRPSPVAYYHGAVSLVYLGDDAATDRYITAARRRFPDDSRLLIMAAWLDFVRGRDGPALERARRLLATHPETEEPRLLLANLVMLAGAADAEAILEPMYRAEPRGQGFFMWQSYRTLYGLLLARRGQRDSAQALWSEALAAAERGIAGGNESFSPRFEIAAIRAVQGDTAAAVEWLDRAYQAGWREARSIARDPFFDGLRGHSRFREIVARAEADVVAMRHRAEQAHPALFRSPGSAGTSRPVTRPAAAQER